MEAIYQLQRKEKGGKTCGKLGLQASSCVQTVAGLFKPADFCLGPSKAE
jgi:hypothetical protein